MKHLGVAQLALLVLVAGIAYSPTLRVGFLYDDHLLIETNPSLRSWSFATLKHDFTSGVFDPNERINFYRPFQILTTRLEYSLFKLNPLPYHLTNLLLHIGNTLLWAVLLIALGFNVFTSLLAGGLFAVHPIIIESLLMVSGRGELLGLFFTLCSLILWLKEDRAAHLLGYVTFILALLSKESAVVAPALFALSVFMRKDPRSRYQYLIPMSIVTGLYLLWRGHVLNQILPPLGAKQTVLFGVMAFPKVLVTYARILLVPWDLHTDRLLPRIGSYWYVYTLSVLGFSGWVLWRGRRWAIFALFWFVLSLIPKAVLMIAGSFMSDHWGYAALPALVLPIALGLHRLWMSPHPAYRRVAQGLFAVLILGEWIGILLNFTQRNTDEKLYRQALRHTTSWAMTYNLGGELIRQRRPLEALPYLEEAQHREPQDPAANRLLAYGYWISGQPQRAVALLETYQRQAPEDQLTKQLLNDIQRHPTTH